MSEQLCSLHCDQRNNWYTYVFSKVKCQFAVIVVGIHLPPSLLD